MSAYQTDEEQLEAIKKWWNQNGKSVIGGVGLGLVIVFGFQGWQQHNQGQSEMASAAYDNFNTVYKADNKEQALVAAKTINTNAINPVYVAFTAFKVAKLNVKDGDIASAKTQLSIVLDSAVSSELKQLARIRLAKLLLNENDIAAAKALIEESDNTAFAGEFAVLLGDIALLEKDLDSAKEQYQKALILGVADRSLLQRKLAESGAG